MKLNPVKQSLKSGFSLVEMLVVIAVIGIMAAIAVPNIGRINESSKEATNRRNAQNIASVYSAGAAAGVWTEGNAATGTDDAINKVIAGATVDDEASPFNGTHFGLHGLNITENTGDKGASEFLEYHSGSNTLRYIGKGGEDAPAGGGAGGQD